MLEWMLHIHLVQRSIVYTCCGATYVVGSAWWRGFCYAYTHCHEKNMSDRACGERIKLTTMGNHGIPDTFYFQTPKRAHFLQTGRKQMVQIFVYQWEVQVHMYIYSIYCRGSLGSREGR